MKSTRPRISANAIVEIITIFADCSTSVLPGHETFFISAKLSLKYLPIFLNILLLPFSLPKHQRVRYDSNVQHPVLETSALTVGATNPLVPRQNLSYFIFVSLWRVCFLSNGQYFISSSLPAILRRFLLVV